MMEKKRNKRKLFKISIAILMALILIHVGKKLVIYIITPKEYIIKVDNRMDYQTGLECSGYSSAYVLRSLGESVNGIDLYNKIPNKNLDGTVPPEILINFLKSEGYQVKSRSGKIIDLKYEVSKGVPVIVFINVDTDKEYLHYVPVVGYDEDYIYVVDSLSYMVNEDNQYYNRKIPIKDFEKIWRETFKVNLYITVNK